MGAYMRLVGVISIAIGVGVIIQLILGINIARGLHSLRDLHAFFGILGLILVSYLFYYSIRYSTSMYLKIASGATLLATFIQVALGLHLYMATSIFISTIHFYTGVLLIILIAVSGAISMRHARSSKRG